MRKMVASPQSCNWVCGSKRWLQAFGKAEVRAWWLNREAIGQCSGGFRWCEFALAMGQVTEVDSGGRS